MKGHITGLHFCQHRIFCAIPQLLGHYAPTCRQTGLLPPIDPLPPFPHSPAPSPPTRACCRLGAGPSDAHTPAAITFGALDMAWRLNEGSRDRCGTDMALIPARRLWLLIESSPSAGALLFCFVCHSFWVASAGLGCIRVPFFKRNYFGRLIVLVRWMVTCYSIRKYTYIPYYTHTYIRAHSCIHAYRD